MPLSIDQYRAWLAERHLQMFALKAGPVSASTSEHSNHSKIMVDAAFSLADEFIAGCKERNTAPWERESL